MARRRWKLRWLPLRLGRASLDHGEPISQAITANGGRRRRGHGDRVSGGAPASSCALLWLTERGQRARVEAMSRGGSSGGVAGVRSNEGELALAMATAEALGAAEAQQLRARTKEEPRK